MKILSMTDFLIEAGQPMFARNMSDYTGKLFRCACGKTHIFQPYMDFQNFAARGVNAKMIVTCPDNSNISTLIQTKYKYLVIFERFDSLAGCVEE